MSKCGQVLDLQCEFRKDCNGRELALLNVLERTVGINQLDKALLRVNSDLYNAALPVVLALSLNVAGGVAGGEYFECNVRSELGAGFGDHTAGQVLLLEHRDIG